ncbi:MAG: hypothetical protein ABIQ33_02970 [Caldimonas sp.]
MAVGLGACVSNGEDAAPTLSRSAQAMGATGLKSLRYTGAGTGSTFGQAYTPGGVWPKITVHSMTRTIDYEAGAMRDEVVMSRAEPLGGGGYPISGQQRNDQHLNGLLRARFATPSSVRPDRLGAAGKGARFVALGERLAMADAMRAIEFHAIAGSPHAEDFLKVYLPQERILIEADAFTPGPPNAAPPSTLNPNHLSLIANIERLGLPVDRIAPLHGRVVPIAELYTAAGKTSPR